MITHLHGVLIESDLNSIVIDVQGVGYEVLVPSSTLSNLPRVGAELLLKTHQTFREDDVSLFGFTTNEERQFFRLLLNVSGVGAKTALSALSSFSPVNLCSAISSSDIKLLSKIPGVGKKSAERIILELRDKVTKLAFAPSTAQVISSGNSKLTENDNTAINDALLALETLGFRPDKIQSVIRDISEQLSEKERSSENLIRRALQELNK